MAKNKNLHNKNKKDGLQLPNQAINAYQQGADPLGSYTGLTEDMVSLGRSMPRRTADGKIYMRIKEDPVQDADDL